MTEVLNNSAENNIVAENEIIRQRIEKVADWTNAGIDPYGKRFDHRQSSAFAKSLFNDDSEEQPTVTIAGRLMFFRDAGGSVFANVKDFSGSIQVYAQKNRLGADNFKLFKKLDIGDIIGVTGVLFKTKVGEITIKIDEYHLLSKNLRPLPEKFHGLTDTESRYRQRYVDLIANDDSMRVFKQRINIIREIRNYMENLGYMEVETPMLQQQAGGASARPFETYYNALNCDMVMRIAPELNLKRLLVGGFEKVF
ncbi:MAG: amino acid--tRNA ligase-related protein, partial [Lentisphaeria bacterium]